MSQQQLQQQSLADCRNCSGAPNLSLNLNPARQTKSSSRIPSAAVRGPQSQRPQSSKHAKGHNIVPKDYYRHMKTDKAVDKHLQKKKAKEMGKCETKTLLDIKNTKYKPIGEIISEQYSRSQIPEGRLYMIDKVVRMRGQHGRFGIDHSELLNYELEQTNKPRDDYMNLLVYKSEAHTTSARDLTMVAPEDAHVSDVLYNRLQVKDQERFSDYSQRDLLGVSPGMSGSRAMSANKIGARGQVRGNGMSYTDWTKAKDAERRLKRKLVGQAQNEIKEELLHVAKSEREKYENRCKAMDDWLMQKKIDEAEKIAHMREMDRREEMEKQMRDERQTSSYKEWMRLQTLKKKQTRKYNKRQQETREDLMARQLAQQEMDQQQRLRGGHQEQQHYDDMDMEDEHDQEDYQQHHVEAGQEPYNPLRYKQHQMQ